MKRIISCCAAILLTLSLGAGISACTPGDKGIQVDENGKYLTELTYTTVRNAFSNPRMPAGWTLTDNPYATQIKEKYNVSWKINWEDSNYDAHVLMDLTSNTLADVFLVQDYSTFSSLYQADALHELKVTYDSFASDGMKAIYDSYGARIWTPVIKNGGIYALPSTANQYQQELLWVRKDWLDRYNLPVPQTIQDIEDTALAFITNNASGSDTTIGLNINGVNSFQGYRNSYGLEPLANAMGAYPGQWMEDANGKVFYGSVQPEFKQVLAKIVDWIGKGIIDKNCFDMDWNTIWANVTLGKAGMWFFPWSWAIDEGTALLKRNPDAVVIPVAAPLDTNGDGYASYASGDPMEGMLCVNKEFANPEAVFKVFNMYADIDADRDDQGYQMLEPMREAGTPWDYVAPLGSYACRYNDTIPRGVQDLKNWLYQGIEPVPFTAAASLNYAKVKRWINGESDLSTTAGRQDWAEWMGRLIASDVENDPLFRPVDPVYFERTQSMQQDWSDLQNRERQFIHDVLTGAASIDTFDSFVADWKAGGGDQATSEVQAEVDAARST